jgi:hypothetical protein
LSPIEEQFVGTRLQGHRTFVTLPLRSNDKLLQSIKLREIGRSDGATNPTSKVGRWTRFRDARWLKR